MDRRVITVEQAEAENPGVPSVPDLAKPFGGVNGQWERLKAAMQPGDELVAFNSPLASWRAFCGRQGVALVRDGQTVMEVVTMLN
ncbi:hypothetical protein [Methylobacterium sp. GC_Met_2]|uniref:hypothetical protein n=1 Tax=Methylobacterium sp. GC_Met_2 TaxID=2937376 RepID=UPI00226B9E9C|nr:hypothetical protein [Methylobacterium sp. GC_Met_2]